LPTTTQRCYVDARAAKGTTLLDARGLQSQLCGLDGDHVTAANDVFVGSGGGSEGAPKEGVAEEWLQRNTETQEQGHCESQTETHTLRDTHTLRETYTY